MSGFAEAARDRVLVAGNVRYEVRPPTVREAIEVLYAMDGIRQGEEEHLSLLMLTIIPGWFPEPFIPVFDDMEVVKQVETLRHLLYTGVVPQKRPEKAEGDEEGDPSPPEPPKWDDLLGSYCMVYSADPWQVYNEVPFPFFMNMVNRSARQLARSALSQVDLFQLPHMTKNARKSTMNRLNQQAGYKGKVTHASKKEINKGRARLKALFGVGQ